MNEYFSPEWLALSRHTGDARRAPTQNMSLTFGSLGGDVLYWQDAASGLLLLTRHDDWLDWVAGLAPARQLQDYTPALRQMLADCTFAPLASLTKGMTPVFQLQKTENLPVRKGLILTLHQDEEQLELLLLQANWTQLLCATKEWEATERPAVERLPVALSLGCSTVYRGELTALVPGCGIRLQQTPDLASDELWLVLGELAARARIGTSNHLHLVSSFDNTMLQLHHNRESGMDNIPLMLTAEIGQVSMTLGELRSLQAGDVLQHLAQLDEQVRLTVRGVTVARGDLIQTDNGWLVRISTVIQTTDEETPWTP